jgi:hypothetical protein
MRTASFATLLAASAVIAFSAPAFAESCNVPAVLPNVQVTAAKGMGCGKANKELGRYNGDPTKKSFKTPGKFKCKRVKGNRSHGTWRCKKGDRQFRFEFRG